MSHEVDKWMQFLHVKYENNQYQKLPLFPRASLQDNMLASKLCDRAMANRIKYQMDAPYAGCKQNIRSIANDNNKTWRWDPNYFFNWGTNAGSIT